MARKEKKFNYKESTVDELNTRLNTNQQELFKLRFRSATTQMKNTMAIRKLRRDIARINTFINQRRQNP